MPDDAEKSKYIPMYYSYIEQLGLLSLEQVGALVMALLVYGPRWYSARFPKGWERIYGIFFYRRQFDAR